MFSVLLMFTGFLAEPDAGPTPFSRNEKLEVRAATPGVTQAQCYGKFEIAVDLKATYDNPFDPEDIDVFANFTSPGGKTFRVNGFLTQAFSRRLEKDNELVEQQGDPLWQVRFAPNETGTWRYRVVAKDRTGRVETPEAEFAVVPSACPGYVRRNTRTPHIFAFDNGQPFFPIGEDMCWGRGPDYEKWLRALSQAGGNWIRFFMCQWNCGIEWRAPDPRPRDYGAFGGLGVYNLCNAWKLDAILDTAEQCQVQVMLCLGTYGEFTTGGFFNEGMWDSNPYNAANGGPCAKPDDFWTNEQARKLYKRRLRYIAARYGWRPNVFAWELWNEAYAPAGWVAEMAEFLKGKNDVLPVDPFRHLVSTTYGTREIWDIPEIDFTQSHQYGEANLADVTPVVLDDARQHVKFGKPHLLAEFGIDWRSSDDKHDPGFRGVNLHNALWSSVLSGDAGSAMIWYWDTYIDHGNLYKQYAVIRRFTDRIPWTEGAWKPLAIDPPQVHVDTEAWRDLAVAPTSTWGRNSVAEFTITPLGGAGNDPMPTFLYGPCKPELRTPLVLHATFDHPGRFDIRVNAVSTKVHVRFLMDSTPVRELDLSANPPEKEGGAPEYESTEFKKEYGIYQARFNKKYGIEVPAGAHMITVDVTDGDWLSVADYAFGGYVSNRFPRVNICGLANGSKAFLWIQNAEHGWLNVKSNAHIEPIRGAETAVHGLADGQYACEWWDTWTGEVTLRETADCAGAAMRLRLPDLATDAAASIQPR